MKSKKIILAVSAVFLCLSISAQNSREYILQDQERSAGFYHAYEVPEPDPGTLTRPKGYKPFYISHYGRHGCRWHTSEPRYFGTLKFLEQGDSLGLLTETGRRFLKDMRVVCADAEGHLGDLSPRGAREHKGIADRMYRTYPEVFHKGAKVDSKSSVFVRCVLSMAAFDESLKEHEPSLVMTRESSQKNMGYIAHGSGDGGYGRELTNLSDSLRKAWIPTERFMNSLFTDSGRFLSGQIRDEESLMYDCFEMAGIMQSCDYLDIDLYYLFNEEEIYQLWRYLNANSYAWFGPAVRYGDHRLASARPLLRNFVETADKVIAGELDEAATLRFGHDSAIVPLISLIQGKVSSVRVPVPECTDHWNISIVSPMAANLQMIFFRDKKGNIKVRVMYNEKDAELPVAGGPFYDWEVLRAFLVSKCD